MLQHLLLKANFMLSALTLQILLYNLYDSSPTSIIKNVVLLFQGRTVMTGTYCHFFRSLQRVEQQIIDAAGSMEKRR